MPQEPSGPIGLGDALGRMKPPDQLVDLDGDLDADLRDFALLQGGATSPKEDSWPMTQILVETGVRYDRDESELLDHEQALDGTELITRRKAWLFKAGFGWFWKARYLKGSETVRRNSMMFEGGVFDDPKSCAADYHARKADRWEDPGDLSAKDPPDDFPTEWVKSNVKWLYRYSPWPSDWEVHYLANPHHGKPVRAVALSNLGWHVQLVEPSGEVIDVMSRADAWIRVRRVPSGPAVP